MFQTKVVWVKGKHIIDLTLGGIVKVRLRLHQFFLMDHNS